PAAPALAAADSGAAGHLLSLTRSAPTFDVHYDASAVHGATSAVIEVSAPAPSIFGSYNTFTNANGTVRDADGFNAGSVVYKPVGHASGTVRLNSLRLGLATSVGYNVRVLATDSHGDVVGQASPSSYLEVDDGLPPQGDYVTDFAATSGAAPAGDAGAVALVTASNGNEVRTYSTTTGHYGAVLAADPSPSSGYQVYGVDAAAHRALLGHTTNDGDQVTAETYDTSTGALLDSVAIASSTATVVAGRVDATRERGVLLLHPVNRGPDTLLPIDLSTGAAKPEIQADPAGATVGGYGLLDLDSSTGLVYLSKQNVSPICFSSGAAALAKVDLDSGTATASPGSSACIGTMTSDQAGGVFTTGARSFSVNITPTTTLTPFDGQSLLPGTLATVRKGTGQAIAVDGVHHLALVAFPAPAGKDRFGTPGGVLTDSNATSQIVVVDLRTGALAETLTDVNFVSGGNSVLSARNRAIQLDPATRTGWTYGPGLSEVEQFSY
ncbi:MAG: peptidase S8, partial [Actinocrinis sp.]